jgi:hypothetical protein
MEEVLVRAVGAIEGAGIAYALMGGVASAAVGRARHTHDIDLFVRPEDAQATLAALESAGFRTERTDPKWLFKAFWEEVLVDVIFTSKGGILFDAEMEARARPINVRGRSVPLLPPEDMVVIKALATAEHVPRHWHDAVGILAAAEIDWSYLTRRARPHLHRSLSLLLYAVSDGVQVPLQPLRALLEATAEIRPGPTMSPDAGQRAEADNCLAARLHEALAMDARVGELHLSVIVDGQAVAVTGKVATEARRTAVEEVVREVAPGRSLDNQVEVLS